MYKDTVAAHHFAKSLYAQCTSTPQLSLPVYFQVAHRQHDVCKAAMSAAMKRDPVIHRLCKRLTPYHVISFTQQFQRIVSSNCVCVRCLPTQQPAVQPSQPFAAWPANSYSIEHPAAHGHLCWPDLQVCMQNYADVTVLAKPIRCFCWLRR